MNRNTRGTDPSTLLRMTCAVLETARRKDNFADHCENLERVHHETIPADKRESSASEYRPAGASRETRPRPAPILCEGGDGRKAESRKQKYGGDVLTRRGEAERWAEK